MCISFCCALFCYDYIIRSCWIHAIDFCQTSSRSCTLVGNTIFDHSDVVGASSVSTAPTTSSFSTSHLASIDCTKTTTRRDEKLFSFGFGVTYIRDLMVGEISGLLREGFELCHFNVKKLFNAFMFPQDDSAYKSAYRTSNKESVLMGYILHAPHILLRIALLALGQSHDCPSAIEANLKDMCKSHGTHSSCLIQLIMYSILNLPFKPYWLVQPPYLSQYLVWKTLGWCGYICTV